MGDRGDPGLAAAGVECLLLGVSASAMVICKARDVALARARVGEGGGGRLGEEWAWGAEVAAGEGDQRAMLAVGEAVGVG